MPTLNLDVLEDIVQKIGEMYDGPEKVDALNTFMLSGKEPFSAALRYFSKAKTISFVHDSFIVCGQKWGFFDDEPKLPLSPVIKGLRDSIEKLEIDETVEEEVVSIDKFIGKKLKYLYLCDHVSAKILRAFMDIKFNEIVANNDNDNYDTVSAFLTSVLSLPSEMHQITLNSASVFDVVGQVHRRRLKFVSNKVEKLHFSHGRFKEDNGMIDDEIERIIYFFNNALPNLKNIDAHLYHWISHDGALINHVLTGPDVFKGIRNSIKGILFFHSNYHFRTDVLDCKELIFDEENGSATTSFEVHEGLVVKIIMNR